MHLLPLTDNSLWGILALLLLGSTFFSGAETGMVALDRYRLRDKVRSGNRTARRIQQMLKRKDRLLGMILVGNNICNIGASVIATLLSQRLLGVEGPLYATMLLTFYILVFAEIAPKTLAALHPERIAYPASWVLSVLGLLLQPLALIPGYFSNLLLRIFGVRAEHEHETSISRSELLNLLEDGEDWLPRQYREMLGNILTLDDIRVDDIMVPRGEVVGIEIDSDRKSLAELIANKRITRFPVYQNELDEVIGVLDARDAIGLLGHGQEQPLDRARLRSLLSKPYFVPENTTLPTQLLNFQRQRQSLGIIVDEYGAVQGVITLQAILEEIVGKFHLGVEPDNTPKRDIFPQKDGSYIANGTATLRDINRELGWDLGSDNGATTLNGLVLERLENLPERNVSISLGGYGIEVLSIQDNNVIHRARLRRLGDSDEEPPEA